MGKTKTLVSKHTQQGVMMNKKPDNVISAPFGQPQIAEKLAQLKKLRQQLQQIKKDTDDIEKNAIEESNNKE